MSELDTQGLTGWRELLPLLKQVRKQGVRIVFTNGVFDILHAGHVTYLEAAAALGDRLVVGLNSDASVRRLKGPRRPVVSERHRHHLLRALRCVDYVVLFDEDTPLELISALQPDILVKGADYRLEDIVGGSEVLAAGGEVRTIAMVPGLSTSGLVAKILEIYGDESS
ncbi:MAG: D-glycero-beta-D-manno-heptose 1-phosphate adenylyltransferase [Candidatus Delongbacteria bacterium]|nr:D-glycero-beta-D-manno-heptose 1-phosphate adenylyltransferase [bacterium]MBL7033409.1 D-glycero-beta-D-manno-heptose 1-phosphate adenylyltransferase [Candidatus Delongbacteria bacterium]